jgi:hypothetical protein
MKRRDLLKWFLALPAVALLKPKAAPPLWEAHYREGPISVSKDFPWPGVSHDPGGDLETTEMPRCYGNPHCPICKIEQLPRYGHYGALP